MSILKIVQLSDPIEIKNEDGSKQVIDKVTIQKLKIKHLRTLPTDIATGEDGEMQINDIAKMFPFYASVLGLPIEAFDELSIEDFENISDEMESEIKKFQKVATPKN